MKAYFDSFFCELFSRLIFLQDALNALKKLTQDAAKIDEYDRVLESLDNFGGPELGEHLRKYNVKAPETGFELSEPFPFNLMFTTQIGPTGKIKGYETEKEFRLIEYISNFFVDTFAQKPPKECL